MSIVSRHIGSTAGSAERLGEAAAEVEGDGDVGLALDGTGPTEDGLAEADTDDVALGVVDADTEGFGLASDGGAGDLSTAMENTTSTTATPKNTTIRPVWPRAVRFKPMNLMLPLPS